MSNLLTIANAVNAHFNEAIERLRCLGVPFPLREARKMFSAHFRLVDRAIRLALTGVESSERADVNMHY